MNLFLQASTRSTFVRLLLQNGETLTCTPVPQDNGDIFFIPTPPHEHIEGIRVKPSVYLESDPEMGEYSDIQIHIAFRDKEIISAVARKVLFFVVSNYLTVRHRMGQLSP